MKHDAIQYSLIGIGLAIGITALSVACVAETQSVHTFTDANGFNGTITGTTLELKTSITTNGLLSNDDGKLVLASDEDVTSKLLTGYVESSGTVTADDTILEAIQKLSGNTNITVLEENGFQSATGPNLSLSISASDGLLSAQSHGIVSASSTDVTSKLLTGFVASPGTVTATDTILQAFQKLAPSARSLTRAILSTPAGGGSTSITNGSAKFTSVTNLALSSFSNDFSLTGQVLTYTGTQTKTFCMTVQITVNNPSVNDEYWLWIQKGSSPTIPNNLLTFRWKSDVAQFLTYTITDMFELSTNDTLQLATGGSGTFPFTLTHPVVSYYVYEI